MPRFALAGAKEGVARGALALLAALCATVAVAQSAPPAEAGAVAPPRLEAAPRVDFGRVQASAGIRHVAHWVLRSGDHQGLPFVLVDKTEASVFVFSPQGLLLGVAPALLGLAVGDHTVPGIGERKLSSIRPEERTTPAGRFVAALDKNLHGHDILWVDYDSAVSLHPVRSVDPSEQRVKRLNSPSAADNRISYGCINVPLAFFNQVVVPAFAGTQGVVYVLPETRPVREVFGSSDTAD